MIMLRQAAFLLLLPAPAVAAAQDVPAASSQAPYTGFELPDVSGTLRYTVNASERFVLGYNATDTNSTSPAVNGTIAYLSGSPTSPFSAVYTGTYLAAGTGEPSEVASSFALSQVIVSGRWRYVVADIIQYLPESPVSGLSGLPGSGDANIPPLPGSGTGQEIQSTFSQNVDNVLSGTVSRGLTPATSLFATASQNLIRYLDVPGGSTTDENGYNLLGGINHQIDASTGTGVQYSHDAFHYLSSDFTVTSQTINVLLNRSIGPSLSVSGSIGPQFTSSSNSLLEPSRTSLAITARAQYHSPFLNGILSFSRNTSAGSGLIVGTETNLLSLNTDRQFGRVIHVSAYANYVTLNSLQAGADNTQSLSFGGQVNRSVLRNLSAFVSYTGQRQLNQGNQVSSLALNGLTQTIAVGLSYAPSAFRIGRH